MRKRWVVAVVVAPALLSACSMVPAPVTSEEMAAVVEADRTFIEKNNVPVTAPITQEEAVARALKHNLDYRSRILEQNLAAGQFDAGKFDMLPRVLASAGYSWRDKELTRNSIDSVTGAPSLSNPSISTDRAHATWDIGLSWSVLDFGVSYYNAQQNADRLLVANERRRKAMHTLIQNVRSTYWRALAAQKLRAQVAATTEAAEAALADSRKILESGVKNPGEPLRYQRNLLENLRLMENVEHELAAASIELASLIGARVGDKLELVEPENIEFKPLTTDLARMEEMALMNNADLREQVYNVRIAAVETRKALVKLLPNVSFDYGFKNDNDKYLINQSWQEAGVKVGFNLFNLLSGPAQIKAAEMNTSVTEAKRMALQMAVLSQVHMSAYQYEDALRQYQRSVAIYDVDHKLAEIAINQERSATGNKLERISANVTSILSAIRMYHAVSKVNEAISRVQASLGLEPEIGSLDDISLEDLTAGIAKVLKEAI